MGSHHRGVALERVSAIFGVGSIVADHLAAMPQRMAEAITQGV
jgi:hypothetical protein